MDLGNEDLIQRTAVRLAWLRENQRQLLRDIQQRYNELGQAVDHLRSYFSSDSGDDQSEQNHHRVVRIRKSPRERKRLKLNEAEMNKISRPLTSQAVAHLRNREYGVSRHQRLSKALRDFYNDQLPDFVSQQLPAVLSEKEFDLGTVNKIFASQWLNEDQVVLGTKCNKLMIMDVRNNSLVDIQSLKSSDESQAAESPCGIHSIAINPSRTMLATGAKNTNDLAVYELPTFDPLCVGEQAHKDWIFDMEWVDDQHLVTGSRDSSVALWRVCYEGLSSRTDGKPHPLGYRLVTPCVSQHCQDAARVRALAVGWNKQMMGVLSMNAKFHFFDLHTFRQTGSVDLQWKRENVCVASSDQVGMFAVGSQAYVTLIDHRTQAQIRNCWLQIPSRNGERGIRSVGFNHNIITIGTGDGRMLFYDIRNHNFLETMDGQHCELKVGEGWLRDDVNYREHFIHGNYPNAVYTHCYDEWRTRLFVAGGPLPTGLYGNYAGLFY